MAKIGKEIKVSVAPLILTQPLAYQQQNITPAKKRYSTSKQRTANLCLI
jgi:hypothetical protein